MIRLEDTSGGAVAAAIAAERHRMGSAATGMVLSLLILTDEEYQADATAAAVAAARQHPMRIVTIIPRPSRHEPRLDAEIAVGGDDGPGEVHGGGVIHRGKLGNSSDGFHEFYQSEARARLTSRPRSRGSTKVRPFPILKHRR